MYDLYNILEVKNDATKCQIRRSYIKLCFKYHPDKTNKNSDNFIKLTDAYNILYNNDTRKIYDKQQIYLYDKNMKKLNDMAYIIFEKSVYNLINSIIV